MLLYYNNKIIYRSMLAPIMNRMVMPIAAVQIKRWNRVNLPGIVV